MTVDDNGFPFYDGSPVGPVLPRFLQGASGGPMEYSQATRRGHLEASVISRELPHGAPLEERDDFGEESPPRPVLRPVLGEWADTWEDEPGAELTVPLETFARRRFKQRSQVPLRVQELEAESRVHGDARAGLRRKSDKVSDNAAWVDARERFASDQQPGETGAEAFVRRRRAAEDMFAIEKRWEVGQ